ncbi:four helix bundle protein [candidate division KSB1 bacterium]|nr:four helix bundle protein [candidate division KSB1 bacterium]
MKNLEMNKNELEERLINFSVLIINIMDEMPDKKAGNHLSGQLIHSGTSPALNYDEAQGAESRKYFVHKLKNCFERIKRNFVTTQVGWFMV